MKKKVLFIVSPVILAVVTLIWLFYESGRWYDYRQEWPWMPLLFLHLLFPLFYLTALIVSIIRQVNRNTRSDSGVFYIVSSVIMMIVCFVGLLTFLIMTSGA